MSQELKEKLTSKKANLTSNARVVLEKRYLIKDNNGKVTEQPEDMFFRVAENIASVEKSDADKWVEVFYNMMVNLDFLPNSPTLMNAGRELQQLSACFVIPVGDSMEEIFEAVKNSALIHKSGGGTGFSFSRLRPKNDLVKSTSGVSSGPVSFMRVFDITTDTVKQAGLRRGANMGLLRCDHPDIEEFIRIKEKDGMLPNFNISVGITNEFMEALENDAEYALHNPRTDEVVGWLNAKKIFNTIVELAWKNGEPGIIFIDRINEKNQTPHIGKIESTNPCITGDTLVAVADGRVAVSIKQLAEEDKDVPVYCRNNKDQITIRMMRHPRITSKMSDIFEIKLDNGNMIKATSNHEILLSNGKMTKVSELKYGDSIHVLNKIIASFHEIIENSKATTTQKYFWIEHVPEHRMIYEFYKGPIPKGYIIHHINYNSKDNRIENLKCMTVEAHNDFHKEGKLGDKNPMRRAQTEWSKEKWQQYHDMSEAVSGELNGRFSGISNEDLFKKAVELSKIYERKLSVHDWENFALKNGYPSQFSKYRADIFGTVEEFLNKASIEAEVCGSNLRQAELREFKKFFQLKNTSNLNLFFEDGVIKVKKLCEGCAREIILSYSDREQCYCSLPCANINREITEEDLNKRRESKNIIRENKRIQQINAFNDFRLEFGRIPMKKEFAPFCKKRKIPFRLPVKREIQEGRLIGTFNNWEELKEKALQYNHRVLSVTYIGQEPVYNGTVDDFHNFYFGGFKEVVDGKEKIVFTNGKNCGEQPLLPFESCNLGSINLLKMITEEGKIDFEKLKVTVHNAVRFLDNIIDANKYPLQKIADMTKGNRKIGLGLMGFADALVKMKISYNSEEAISTAESVMGFIRTEGHKESMSLAAEKGQFPNFNGSIYDKLGNPLIRNATVTTIAPTGSISMIAGCSSGIEPLFALGYEKHCLDGKDLLEINPDFLKVAKEKGFHSEDLMKLILKSGSIAKIDVIPESIRNIFITAHDVSPLGHIAIQAAFQKFTDNAVSKTVNFAHNATQKDVEDVYRFAYAKGCKGVTVYRDGSRANQVLTTGAPEKVSPKDDVISRDVKLPPVFENGPTHVIKKEGKKFYLHFSYLPEDEKKERPICLWIYTNFKYGVDELKICNKVAHKLQKLAIEYKIDKRFIKETVEKARQDYPHNRMGRMISLCMRHRVPRESILLTLMDVNGDNVSTLLTAVRKFMSQTLANGTKLDRKCPQCKVADIYMAEGCMRCSQDCGWSAC
jgi:ribonucleotide reductase alpha subunit